MQTAEQMFEELGYKQTRNDNSFIEYQRDDGDQHAEITFSLKDKTFRAIYGRYEFGMTYHYVTSDELKAIVCQAKELGWIEPEHQQETNLEHYYNALLKTGCNRFGVTDGKVKPCTNMSCSQCDLSAMDHMEYCKVNAIKWLASPYKKPTFKLTQFEYDLLRTNNMSHDRKLSSFATYKNLREIGYFKDIDFDLMIGEILENCEIKGE